jgi:3'-5' exoribonuclease
MTQTFSPNETFDRIFLLKGIDERRTKTGKPYLAVVLGTSGGSWDARVWDMAMSSLPGLLEGDPVHVTGSAQLYQENIQLIVDTISKVEDPVDPRAIYPATSASEDELRAQFLGFAGGIEEPMLRTLMDVMLKERVVSDAFFTSPAAITMHHARIGGLAEHSLSVCRLAHAATSAAPWLNRDILTAGALLHDIGKVLEYEVAGDFRYTLEGKFLGHIIQGQNLVERWIARIPDFPERLALDVLHIILSHHGQLEFGSPKVPVTAEALVIHFADDLDAKLDMIQSAGKGPGTGEAFVRGLRRSFHYRSEAPPGGLDGPEGKGEEESEEEKMGNGETEKADTETRGHGEREEKILVRERGREGEREKELDTRKRRNPSTGSGQTGKKKDTQEELF